MGQDYGLRGETGERTPKGASAADTVGEKKVAVPKADKESGTAGESGEREPKSSKASDASGEEHKAIVGGVGMGKADSIKGRESGHMGKHDGRTGEHNTGKQEGHFMKHKKEYDGSRY